MVMNVLMGWFLGRTAVGEGNRAASGDRAGAAPRSRRVSVEMVNRVGHAMFEKHRVPATFRDTILAAVLQARSGMGGGSDDMLSDDEWTAIREAEVRLLFLTAIKSKLSLGRQLNFTASSEYSFVSPQLKEPLLINAGNPFRRGINTSSTMDTEAKFVLMCAELFGAAPDKIDGFVATGGSESNSCAVRWAGEQFPGAPFIGGASMHFSLKRAIKFAGRELLEVEARGGGEMDIGALGRVLSECKGRGIDAVCLMLVCGTTMSQAHDNIDAAIDELDRAGYDSEHRYVHVDAAYSGFVLPFLRDVDPGICIDFARQGLSSCSASLQKALGVSCPGSVFIIKKDATDPAFFEYIQTTDITLSCSRNGYPVLEAWAMLTHVLGTGREEWSSRWRRGVAMAADFKGKLEKAGVVAVTHNPSSVTVVFPQPPDSMVLRYSLVVQDGRAEIMFNFHNLDGVASGLFLREYLMWYAQ